MKQITGFMSEITDEFKVIVVDAIRSLCLKFPAKQAVMLGFLSGVLRDEGGFEFKRAVVEAIFDLVKFIPECKEAGMCQKAICHLLNADRQLMTWWFCHSQLSRISASLLKIASLLSFQCASCTFLAWRALKLRRLPNTSVIFTTESFSKILLFVLRLCRLSRSLALMSKTCSWSRALGCCWPGKTAYWHIEIF